MMMMYIVNIQRSVRKRINAKEQVRTVSLTGSMQTVLLKVLASIGIHS
jgi:hypothetical protein